MIRNRLFGLLCTLGTLSCGSYSRAQPAPRLEPAPKTKIPRTQVSLEMTPASPEQGQATLVVVLSDESTANQRHDIGAWGTSCKRIQLPRSGNIMEGELLRAQCMDGEWTVEIRFIQRSKQLFVWSARSRSPTQPNKSFEQPRDGTLPLSPGSIVVAKPFHDTDI